MSSKTVQNDLLQQLLSDHPWTKSHKIEVSPGFISIIDDYLKEVEAILGPNPKLDFFRVAEGYELDSAKDEVSALYKRKLIVFCDPTESKKAQDHALDLVGMNAASASVEVCFQCGHALKVMNLSNDKIRTRYPFLPEALSHVFSNSTVCLACAEVDFNVAQAKSAKKNLVPENATIQEIEHMLAMAQVELSSRRSAQPSQVVAVPPKAPRKKPKSHTPTAEVEIFSMDQADEFLEMYPAINTFVKIFDIRKMEKRFDETKERSIRGILGRFDFSLDNGFRTLRSIDSATIKKLYDLKGSYPNCTEFIDYVIGFALLAVRKEIPYLDFPPIILLGPPGVGKTAVCEEVAKIIDIPCKPIDIGSTSSSFVLGGACSAWADSKAGAIVDLLRDNDSASGIVILDEIDKTSQDAKFCPLAPLYSLLEKGTAKRFVDEALEIPIDASHLMYVATANKLETIPAPILDRFVVIKIEAIKPEHHKVISQSIYRSILKAQGVSGVFGDNLDDHILEGLCKYTPRSVKLILTRATALAAKRDQKSKQLSIHTDDIVDHDKEDCGRRIGF